MTERLGAPDILSELLTFEQTSYYEDEMGKGLRRKVASFDALIDPSMLSELKMFTNGLEAEFSRDGKRRVNIDPGYMALEKFVLASCKNFSHRIYIGGGVYADLTLIYTGGGFATLPWTYPDYTEKTLFGIVKDIRRRYALQIGRG